LTSGPEAQDSFHLDVGGDDVYGRPPTFTAPRSLAPHARAALHADPDVLEPPTKPGHTRMRVRYDGVYARADGTWGVRRARPPWVDVDVVP